MMEIDYYKVQRLSKKYNTIPICKEIYGDMITPIALLQKISQISNKYYLLESVEGGEKWGRYSFLGYDPVARFICKGGQVTMVNGKGTKVHTGNPFEVLKDYISRYKAPKLKGLPPFVGGLVGYFSYDMFAYTEDFLERVDSGFNDFDLMLFEKVIVYDHLKEKIIIVVNISTDDLRENYIEGLKDIKKILSVIREKAIPPKTTMVSKPAFICNVSKAEYLDMVKKAKDHIKKGDIFQTVISRRFETDYRDSLLNAYRVLRTTNPSPYMVFLENGDIQLISSSPETLVRLNNGLLSTFPIAGSRPRGKSQEEDMALEEELLQDEKELAEHNMLVDLARNDMGKISELSSVQVINYKKVQRYSQVMHITSEVRGRIKDGKGALDSIEALLPAGTLVGAPKIPAFDIIARIERQSRGIYGGAIGYIGFNGNMDVCIAIRMAIKKDHRVYVQAGGGIVADSVPEREYEEVEDKARALIEAIMTAEEVEKL